MWKTINEGAGALIDKLEVGVPRSATYTPRMKRILDISMRPEWRSKVWREGSHYHRRGDLREVSNGEFPVIVHQMNRHDHNAGDKVEIVESGVLSLSRMKQAVRGLYSSDVNENRVMRLDLCADVLDIPVQWFWENVEVKGKRSARQWLTGEHAETFTAGKKPHQIRVYDKTGHRRSLLMSENRKLRGDPELCALEFHERWGYPLSQVVTRVERQMGGKAELNRFGYSKVGYLGMLWTADPFDQIRFANEVKIKKALRSMPVKDQIFAEWIRQRVLEHGVEPTKNEIRRMVTISNPSSSPECQRRKFNTIWTDFKSFALPAVAGNFTRDDLLRSYRASIHTQLAPAA